jgi:isoleucyl-tRNA synthetase
MFREVPSKVSFPQMEERILQFWKEHDTFQKSMELRKDAPRFVFYEGPPTANGLPGIHHVLGRIYKDTIPRYHTMKGQYCLRKGGWDTHGLPVEIEVEKELGFTGRGKQAIEEYGVAKFNELCKESVFRYVKEWTALSDRIGFWLDMDDPYVTLSSNYIESVWWILKQIWDKGLLYKGFKSVPYCPRCETPLSDHEVAQGYEEVEDPSIFVKFPLQDEPGVYFLAWTTTPWTLPGNAALAVHPDVEYVMVEQDEERLILAKPLMDATLRGQFAVVKSISAQELVGKHYKPLYTFLPVDQDYCRVIAADFVNTEEGTGIVHIAPAFGAEDLEAGEQHKLPILQTVDVHGKFVDAVTPWRGMFVKDADPLIISDLRQRGLMYHVGRYKHIYPFCWRCDSPLLYYGKPTWFIGTQRLKDRLMANNQLINWYPSHIRDGRFGNWLENNVDWALGRDRYWGTPLPVWVCEQCHEAECFGSVQELRERALRTKRVGLGRSSFDLSELDLHRPYIDEVVVTCKCGGAMRRTPEVIDCWFDSGSMPVAQWHYPFENEERFKEQFPADFICEGIDQTRGWFYSLHAISVLLFDQPCFLNCISFGHVLDGEGQKMSKSRGNVIDPWDVIQLHGADAMRWSFYTASPPDYPRRFSLDLVAESVRKFALTLWNTYSFFVTYAQIDGFDPRSDAPSVSERPALDRWILSELNQLVQQVDTDLARYEMTRPARAIQDLIEDLSNWYVRRSRRRFWKSEVDKDKAAAHHTLYECLLTLCKLIAPFQPFTAEEMYQNLVRSWDSQAPESVHFCEYPQADPELIDEQLMAETQAVMRVVTLGHAARNEAGIKVRQPLALAIVKPRSQEEMQGLGRLVDQIRDELNVHEVQFTLEESDLVEYQIAAVPSQVGRKFTSLFPAISGALAHLRGPAARRAAEQLRDDKPLRLTAEVLDVTLEPEDVEVRTSAKSGFALNEGGGYIVALRIEIDEELRLEGLAREIVRRIQTMRKDAGFSIEDTITTWYQAAGSLQRVFDRWGKYIRQETLSRQLLNRNPAGDAYMQTYDLDGESLTLGVRRIDAST